MGRKLRVQYPGAIYHVMNRGDRRELQRLGWDFEDLNQQLKGDLGKVGIAQRLRAETTVSRKWIAQRLCMGSVSMVAHCLRDKR